MAWPTVPQIDVLRLILEDQARQHMRKRGTPVGFCDHAVSCRSGVVEKQCCDTACDTDAVGSKSIRASKPQSVSQSHFLTCVMNGEESAPAKMRLVPIRTARVLTPAASSPAMSGRSLKNAMTIENERMKATEKVIASESCDAMRLNSSQERENPS